MTTNPVLTPRAATTARLLVVVENYPQLKSNENFMRLMDELSGTENRIAVARGRQRNVDGWVARANNASFGAQSAYDDLVPAFEALYQREGRDWPRFHAAVRRIAALPHAEIAVDKWHLVALANRW